MGAVEQAKKLIAAVPTKHPFDLRYERFEKTDWESCDRVLAAEDRRAQLARPW